MNQSLQFLAPFAWPLVALVVALLAFFVLRALVPDVRALSRSLAALLGAHASKHAMFYAIVVGFGMQAFGTGFYDNFWPIEPENMAKLGWWQVLAALLKSMSFAIGIMVGYALKGPQAETKGDTTSLTTTETKTETVTKTPPNLP